MAVAALPATGQRSFRRARAAVAALGSRVLRPARPVARNLASIPGTVAGWALVSAGVFSVSTTAGLIVSGVILMVLEHQAADE